MPGPRSATGCDLIELELPGSPDLVLLALSCLEQAGAEPARPGEFTRQALVNRRLRLDQAEALLALAQAGDAEAAARARERLRGAVGDAAAEVRRALLALRAGVEAGLDFSDEDGVVGLPSEERRRSATVLLERLRPFQRTADAEAGPPLVALVGPANAGKSALFTALTGHPALVSPVPGTTRDWLEAPCDLGGRSVLLLDTAGWLALPSAGPEAEALAASHRRLQAASLVLVCGGPEALPSGPPGLPPDRCLLVGTKADLVPPPPGILAVSALTGEGLEALRSAMRQRLSATPCGEPRQQRLLALAAAALSRLAGAELPDELVAEECRQAAEHLGELCGETSTEEVLDAIFSRFCIGK